MNTIKPQLIITQNTDGSVTVSGPIDQKMWCYGMLEMARDAIKDFKPSPIIKPVMNIVNGEKPN